MDPSTTAGCRQSGRCPHCHGTRIWKNGWRIRTATIMRHGNAVFLPEIRCRRLRCARCRRSWTVLGRHKLTRTHFHLAVVARGVAMVLRGRAQEVVAALMECSRRTVGRWLRRFVAATRAPALGPAWPFAARVHRQLHTTA